MMDCTIMETGSLHSPDYRVYFKKHGDSISPWHDIPLYPLVDKKVLSMVVEMPRWSNAKMEIAVDEAFNPIKQDLKNGKPRFLPNCFPYHGCIWNYGALPQTWEDPDQVDKDTNCRGDNDPIDIIEIGQRVAKRGKVLKVKALGAIALIDQGETDWKIIAIDISDPLAGLLHDVADVDKYCPGLLRATFDWFRIYKIPEGKPENRFAFSGEAKSADFAYKVIEETHKFWEKLHRNPRGRIALINTTLGNDLTISGWTAAQLVDSIPCFLPPLPVDEKVNTVHYVKGLDSKL